MNKGLRHRPAEEVPAPIVIGIAAIRRATEKEPSTTYDPNPRTKESPAIRMTSAARAALKTVLFAMLKAEMARG
jgi:hypothetical protein